MKNKTSQDRSLAPALFIGIDWADKKHDIYTIDCQGHGTHEQIEHSAEAIDMWVAEKLRQAGGRPIAIILEQSRGGLVHSLMFRDNVILYPVNPKQFARYRESYSNAGCKNDREDARLLARMLRERISTLKPWTPDDEATRLLARLSQTRRQLVDERTRLNQQLLSQLKSYYLQVFQLISKRSITPLILEVVRRWPDPRQLRRADRRVLHRVLKEHGYRNEETRQEMIATIRSAKMLTQDRALIEPAAVVVQCLAQQIALLEKSIAQLEKEIKGLMRTHEDAALFTALPGAGAALAPRLLTSFGSDRSRYADADEVATFSGIAPVTKQTGQTRVVRRRYAAPKFMRQTFHEHADHARKHCPWSRAYYKLQRSRGMKHHAALRKLATRWIRIMFRVWMTQRPYDPAAYMATIKRKNPAIIPFLEEGKASA